MSGETAFPSVDTVEIIQLPHFPEENGDLVVMEGLVNVPFAIARVFVVRAPEGAVRGRHAHRECSQFLTCPRGVVEVACDDGAKQAVFLLDHPRIGLLIPPGIWSQQDYKVDGTALTVLCDRPYEAEDYIRHYEEYLTYRESRKAMR